MITTWWNLKSLSVWLKMIMMIYLSNLELIKIKLHLKLRGILEESFRNPQKTSNRCKQNQFKTLLYNRVSHKYLLEMQPISLVSLAKKIRLKIRLKKKQVTYWKKERVGDWIKCLHLQEILENMIRELQIINNNLFKKRFQEIQTGMRELKESLNKICLLVSLNTLH